jgi:hypothetical protein
MTRAINGSLLWFNRRPEADFPLPVLARYGNSVWLALAAAVCHRLVIASVIADSKILLLLGTILYGIKMFEPSAKSESPYHVNGKDVELDQVPSH